MDAKIDWISFTLPMYVNEQEQSSYELSIEVAVKAAFGEELANKVFQQKWVENPYGRKPYSRSWTLADCGISIFTSEKLPHMLIELSGQGCDYLRSVGCETEVLEAIRERLSRLDIAVDIITDTKPTDFVAAKSHRKETTKNTIQSQSGETVYVGSTKSERYCRVYRYSEPHPRSAAMRVEEVFRRKHARSIAVLVVDFGILATARAIGEDRGWTHPCWGISAGDRIDLNLPRPEREGKNTVRWLITQAAPAFRRLVAEGRITNPEEWLHQWFLDELEGGGD